MADLTTGAKFQAPLALPPTLFACLSCLAVAEAATTVAEAATAVAEAATAVAALVLLAALACVMLLLWGVHRLAVASFHCEDSS